MQGFTLHLFSQVLLIATRAIVAGRSRGTHDHMVAVSSGSESLITPKSKVCPAIYIGRSSISGYSWDLMCP